MRFGESSMAKTWKSNSTTLPFSCVSERSTPLLSLSFMSIMPEVLTLLASIDACCSAFTIRYVFMPSIAMLCRFSPRSEPG